MAFRLQSKSIEDFMKMLNIGRNLWIWNWNLINNFSLFWNKSQICHWFYLFAPPLKKSLHRVQFYFYVCEIWSLEIDSKKFKTFVYGDDEEIAVIVKYLITISHLHFVLSYWDSKYLVFLKSRKDRLNLISYILSLVDSIQKWTYFLKHFF